MYPLTVSAACAPYFAVISSPFTLCDAGKAAFAASSICFCVSICCNFSFSSSTLPFFAASSCNVIAVFWRSNCFLSYSAYIFALSCCMFFSSCKIVAFMSLRSFAVSFFSVLRRWRKSSICLPYCCVIISWRFSTPSSIAAVLTSSHLRIADTSAL